MIAYNFESIGELHVAVLNGYNLWTVNNHRGFSHQAWIHTSFHQFKEIGWIFHNKYVYFF